MQDPCDELIHMPHGLCSHLVAIPLATLKLSFAGTGGGKRFIFFLPWPSAQRTGLRPCLWVILVDLDEVHTFGSEKND